jgi:arsenate reductase
MFCSFAPAMPRARSSPSILKKDGDGRFRSFSAGSQPKGAVNPFALKVLRSFDYPAEGFRSKVGRSLPEPTRLSWISSTVCDSAAGEACPVWPGQPMTAHWGIEDPAAVDGPDIQKEAAFVAAFRYMKNRISAFTSTGRQSRQGVAPHEAD